MRLFALRCYVEAESREAVLSTLIKAKISFSRPRREEYGFSFLSNIYNKKEIMAWGRANGVALSFEYEGLLLPIYALKDRLGIIFGVVFSLFLIYLSTFFVWSVRIEGNEELSDAHIIALLEECGFSEGVKKSSVDVNEIQNMALSRCHELSFLSINVHGLVADVVVHERRTSPKQSNPTEPYNLVADNDGVIVSSLILNGQALFEVGDTVYRGQLLVSGLVDSTSGTALLAHSKGKVYARTNRSLTFEVPLQIVEKQYTDMDTTTGYRVLGLSLFPRPKGKTGDFDVTLEESEVRLFGFLAPLTREVRHFNYYENKLVTIDYETAEKIAYEEYKSYLSTELDSACVIDELFSVEKKDGSLILYVEVSAIENIAVEKKIGVKTE